MFRLAYFENKTPFFWLKTGILLVAGIGIADIATGNDFAFSLFYLIPICLVT